MEAGWTRIETYNMRLETDLRTSSLWLADLAAQPRTLCGYQLFKGSGEGRKRNGWLIS